MNENQLANLLCDQRGSHIANAFFDSEYVGEKSREKLFKVLQVSTRTLCNLQLFFEILVCTRDSIFVGTNG